MQCLIVGKVYGVKKIFRSPGFVYGSVHKGQAADGNSACQCIRNLPNGPLPHSVGDEIRAAVQEEGTFQAVRPVIVVGQSPEACFDAAQDNGDMGEVPAYQAAVDHGSPIRAPPGFSSRRIGVGVPALFGHGVMVDHGIHIPGGYQKSQPGRSEEADAVFFLPIRLGNNGYRVAPAFQNPADNGRTERSRESIRNGIFSK